MRKRLRSLAILMAFTMTISSFGDINYVKAKADARQTSSECYLYAEDEEGNVKKIAAHELTGDVILDDEMEEPDISSLSDYYEEVSDALGYEEELKVTSDAASLPATVDNTLNNSFPVIGNQYGGSCGCWADVYYTATNTLNKARGTKAKNGKKNIDINVLSPEFVYNQTRISKNTSNGTYSSHNTNFLLKYGSPSLDKVVKSGVSGWSDTWNPTEEAWKSAMLNRPSSCSTLDIPVESDDTYNTRVKGPNDHSLDIVKRALNDGAVLPFATYVYSWQWKTIGTGSHQGEDIYYSSDTKYLDEYNYDYGSHKMTIVGYDDNIWCDINGDGVKQQAEMGAFKIANSWGTGGSFSVTHNDTNTKFIYFSMNNGGCHWISYDAINKVSAVSGVESTSSRRCIFNEYPTLYTVKAGQEYKIPSLYLTATLNTGARNQIGYLYVDAYKNGSLVESKDMYEVFGRYNFHETDLYGNTSDYQDGTVALDISDIVSGLTEENYQDYTFKVRINDNKSDDKQLLIRDMCIKNSDGKVLEALKSYDRNTGLNGTGYTFELQKVNAPVIQSLTPSKECEKVTEGMNVTFTANASSYGKLQYEFVLRYDMDTKVVQAYSDSNTYTWNTKYSVYPTELTVNVKDTQTGKVSSKTIGYRVNAKPYITGIKMAPNKMKVGEKAQFIISGGGGTGQLYRKYEVSYNGGSYTVFRTGVTTEDVYWTPDKKGSYNIRYTLYDENNFSVSQVYPCTVISDKLTEIYYSNDSWTQAYIHYKTENGNWTSVPGVLMQSDSSQTGYTWKYEIDLGDNNSGYTDVCFNNGSGSWDSRNGANYRLTKGTWGIKNGEINQLGFNASVNLTKSSETSKDKIIVSVNATGGRPAYDYSYKIYRDGVMIQNSPSYGKNTIEVSAYQTGNYKVEAAVKDSTGATVTVENTINIEAFNFKSINASQTEGKVGEQLTFNVTAASEMLYKNNLNSRTWQVYNASGNCIYSTTNIYNSFNWTPDAAGQYTIKCSSRDVNWENAQISMNINVKADNTVTVYYKNSNYSSANIHYQVGNGSWTNVPGAAMEASDRSDYTWKYTIELGDSNTANVCFNENGNNWDSRNGQNYQVSAGKYAIVNGNVINLN